MTRRELSPFIPHRHTSVGLRWPLHTGVRTARRSRYRAALTRPGFSRHTAQSDTERGIRHNVTFRDIITFTYTAAHIMAHMLSRLGRSVRSIN